jgi:hypothetical protein
VEFERDWNLPSEQPEGDQNFGKLNVSLNKEDIGNLTYELNTFFIGGDYKGIKNGISTQVEAADFNVFFDGSMLNTEQESQGTRFYRNRARLSRDFKVLEAGFRQEMENNRFEVADSLLATSYSFFQWEAFIKTPDTSKVPVSITYKNRRDNLPSLNELKQAFAAQDLELFIRPLNKASHRLSVSGTFRSLMVKDTLLTEEEPENSLVGRIEHFLRLFKGAVTFNTYYEVGSGLDRKQEYYYLKVPDGEGIYTWVDYNGDGVEQLNEFEIAPFPDQANYIRVFVQSDQFVKNYYNKFTESVNINPAAVWKTKGGIREFLAKFSNQLVYRTENKSTTDDPAIAYNPFNGINTIDDTTLISRSSSFRNTIYFDRINPKFSMDFSIQRNANKTLLINGFETRRLSSNTFNLRWNFFEDWTFKALLADGRSQRGSDFFSANNFSLKTYDLEPRFIWQAGANIRLELFYHFTQKTNELSEESEQMMNHSGGIEFNFRILNKGNLLIKGNYLNIRYAGDTNTPLAFEMLEGFLPGDNATWSVSYQQSLSKFLQLNLVYDGRRSEGAKTVHVGSVQVRAHF